MSKIIKIDAKNKLPTRRKVCAYARVSLQTDRLKNSLSNQVSFYNHYINSRSDWEFAGVFVDYGVSGTRTKNREGFNEMMKACDEGKIDLIVCKSISRFARNTLIVIKTIRYLKEKNIEVYFEMENLWTFDPKVEFMLSIMSSLAQSESESISENCKWGIRKRFQNGTIGTCNKHLLGYKYNDELKKYEIIPEEAIIIKDMFDLCIQGLSLRKVADALNEKGYKTLHGLKFQENSVRQILLNEVYVGDTLRQKAYVKDPLTKLKVINKGELPKFYISNTHEGIVNRETFQRAYEELQSHKKFNDVNTDFTGKIRCGCCGYPYTRRKYRDGSYVWYCRSKKDEPKLNCQSYRFNEIELKEIIANHLKLPAFDENIFKEKVDKMTILSNGNILFNTKDIIDVWKNDGKGTNHTRRSRKCQE